MKYQSRPVEVEAMRWAQTGDDGADYLARTARVIVEWAAANGGEARYENRWEGDRDRGAGNRLNRIAVRTINGWAYAAPGHYVVMGDATFEPNWNDINDPPDFVRDFYPCDPETFERRWATGEPRNPEER